MVTLQGIHLVYWNLFQINLTSLRVKYQGQKCLTAFPHKSPSLHHGDHIGHCARSNALYYHLRLVRASQHYCLLATINDGLMFRQPIHSQNQVKLLEWYGYQIREKLSCLYNNGAISVYAIHSNTMPQWTGQMHVIC